MAIKYALLFVNHGIQNTHQADGMSMLFTDRGLMKVTAHPAGGYKPMLPLDTNFKDCRGDNRTVFCFKAGIEQFPSDVWYRVVAEV